jgi:hypothetical protein
MPARQGERQWNILWLLVGQKEALLTRKGAAASCWNIRPVGKREIFHKLSCRQNAQPLNISPNVCGAMDKI